MNQVVGAASGSSTAERTRCRHAAETLHVPDFDRSHPSASSSEGPPLLARSAAAAATRPGSRSAANATGHALDAKGYVFAVDNAGARVSYLGRALSVTQAG